MKITKDVEINETVEVSITLDSADIAAAMGDPCREDLSPEVNLKYGMNNFHRYIETLPDGMLDKMDGPWRDAVAKWFEEQAARFAPQEGS